MLTQAKLSAMTTKSQVLLEKGRKLEKALDRRGKRTEDRAKLVDECIPLAQELARLIMEEVGPGVFVYVEGDVNSKDSSYYYVDSLSGDRLDREDKHPSWSSSFHYHPGHMRCGPLALRELHARKLLKELPLLFASSD